MDHVSGHVSNRQVIFSWRKVTVTWRLARLRRRRLEDTDTPHSNVSQGSQDGLAFLQPRRPEAGRPALCSPLERNTRGTFSIELARESLLRLCAGRRLWEHAVAR